MKCLHQDRNSLKNGINKLAEVGLPKILHFDNNVLEANVYEYTPENNTQKGNTVY